MIQIKKSIKPEVAERKYGVKGKDWEYHQADHAKATPKKSAGRAGTGAKSKQPDAPKKAAGTAKKNTSNR